RPFRPSGEREGEHRDAVPRVRGRRLSLVRREPRRHVVHPPELEPRRRGFDGEQVPEVDGVEGASEDADAHARGHSASLPSGASAATGTGGAAPNSWKRNPTSSLRPAPVAAEISRNGRPRRPAAERIESRRAGSDTASIFEATRTRGRAATSGEKAASSASS